MGALQKANAQCLKIRESYPEEIPFVVSLLSPKEKEALFAYWEQLSHTGGALEQSKYAFLLLCARKTPEDYIQEIYQKEKNEAKRSERIATYCLKLFQNEKFSVGAVNALNKLHGGQKLELLENWKEKGKGNKAYLLLAAYFTSLPGFLADQTIFDRAKKVVDAIGFVEKKENYHTYQPYGDLENAIGLYCISSEDVALDEKKRESHLRFAQNNNTPLLVKDAKEQNKFKIYSCQGTKWGWHEIDFASLSEKQKRALQNIKVEKGKRLEIQNKNLDDLRDVITSHHLKLGLLAKKINARIALTEKSDYLLGNGDLSELNLAYFDATKKQDEYGQAHTINLTNRDCRDADLSHLACALVAPHVVLTNAFLTKSKLQRAELSFAVLEGAQAQGADFSRAALNNANCQKADFSDANLTRADLRSTGLQDANLQGTNLTDVQWSKDPSEMMNQIMGANLLGAKLNTKDQEIIRRELAKADAIFHPQADLFEPLFAYFQTWNQTHKTHALFQQKIPIEKHFIALYLMGAKTQKELQERFKKLPEKIQKEMRETQWKKGSFGYAYNVMVLRFAAAELAQEADRQAALRR